jgi:hypothetical protein
MFPAIAIAGIQAGNPPLMIRILKRSDVFHATLPQFEAVKRTPDKFHPFQHHARVSLRRLKTAPSQQFPNVTNIHAILKQRDGELVAQSMEMRQHLPKQKAAVIREGKAQTTAAYAQACCLHKSQSSGRSTPKARSACVLS